MRIEPHQQPGADNRPVSIGARWPEPLKSRLAGLLPSSALKLIQAFFCRSDQLFQDAHSRGRFGVSQRQPQSSKKEAQPNVLWFKVLLSLLHLPLAERGLPSVQNRLPVREADLHGVDQIVVGLLSSQRVSHAAKVLDPGLRRAVVHASTSGY
jgi:hypothetical protein